MDLIDDTGKPLKGSKSREDIKNILQTVRPKNKEQEMILAKAMAHRLEQERLAKINHKIKTGFDGTFENNIKARNEGDGYTKDRSMRLIASIPPEMLYVAKKVWGPDVIKNKALFRKAFVEDEQGRMCLTVDPKSI